MNKLKRLAVCLSLSACLGAAGAQPATEVQDGIQVKPLSRLRVLAPENVVNEQASQQYAALMSDAQQKGALVPANHPEVVRLRAIANRIIPYATRWNPVAANWKWQVNLLNSNQVNAFCMPGGRIAFFSGILTSLKLTDDEVAAVMGHEIAHALREHGRERMAKSNLTSLGARGVGAVVSGIFGIDPRLADYGANLIGQGIVLKFSRDEEREADLVGLDLAARAGFDPRAGVALWNKMAALNKRAPIELLSTHPGGANRIAEIQGHMNVLLPLYARARGTTVNRLPPYRTTNLAAR
jgi:Zn-dependent protease with chaperone function